MTPSLQEFLAQEGAIGKRESSGTFTLDLGRAVEKLRRYQLQEPGFYLLKVLQSAVLAGARRVEVQVRRWDVKVDFTISEPGSYGYLSQIMSRLDRPAEGRHDSALSYLVCGLQGAMGLGPEMVEWVHVSRQRHEVIQLHGSEISLKRSFQPPADRVVSGASRFHFYLRKTGRFFSLKHLLRSRAAESEVLVRRGQFAPVELLLDGRPLSGQRWAPERKESLEIYVLAPGRAMDRGFQIELPDLSGYRKMGDRWQSPKTASRRFVQFRSPAAEHAIVDPPKDSRLRCRAVLQVPERSDEAAQVTFVRHGVCCSTRAVALGAPGTRCLVSAELLRTDLSGLEVIEDEAWQREVNNLSRLALGHY